MAMNFVPLDKSKHAALKVAYDKSLPHARTSHLSAASIREYAQLSATMPIIFIKDQNDNFRSVGMLGFEQGQNLFLLGDSWKGPHIPMNIVRYPFDVRQDGDKLGVYIDENSDWLKQDEGQPLFDGDQPSKFLADRQQFLTNLTNSEIQTTAFIDYIKELDLFEEIEIYIGYQDGSRRNVNGMYSINEKKLLDLDPEKVADMHKKGFLGSCYALMLSLGQLSRMVELSNGLDNPIQAVQIVRESDPKPEQQAQS